MISSNSIINILNDISEAIATLRACWNAKHGARALRLRSRSRIPVPMVPDGLPGSSRSRVGACVLCRLSSTQPSVRRSEHQAHRAQHNSTNNGGLAVAQHCFIIQAASTCCSWLSLKVCWAWLSLKVCWAWLSLTVCSYTSCTSRHISTVYSYFFDEFHWICLWKRHKNSRSVRIFCPIIEK